MKFDVRHIEIPYRFQYGHALKQHRGLNGIICIAEDEAGNIGYGEAVPRDYVTGESCQSIMSTIQDVAQATSSPSGNGVCFESILQQRVAFAEAYPGPFPSCVLCALDTARCDVLARRSGMTLAKWLGGEDTIARNYCASIGFGKGFVGRTRLAALLVLYRRLGFQKFKVKVGNDDDRRRLGWIRSRLGNDAKIFADANAAWDREQAIRQIEMLAGFDIWAIEEPLQFRAAPAPASPTAKCGGPLLSAHMVRRADQSGLQYAVAAMVGESPVLATAGAHFAASLQKRNCPPRYVQGFSHGLLHKIRFVTAAPRIRQAEVSLSPKPGLGLELDFPTLDSITVNQCQFRTTPASSM